MVPPRVKYLPEEVQQAIVRAKLEWESTADSLPLLVCLLNEQRQALRVNRIIETWRLGRVNEVTGRDMHALLHPQGCPADCPLRDRLEQAWASVQGGDPAEFEISDARFVTHVYDPDGDQSVAEVSVPRRSAAAVQ